MSKFSSLGSGVAAKSAILASGRMPQLRQRWRKIGSHLSKLRLAFAGRLISLRNFAGRPTKACGNSLSEK
jgi:hypothetical protein